MLLSHSSTFPPPSADGGRVMSLFWLSKFRMPAKAAGMALARDGLHPTETGGDDTQDASVGCFFLTRGVMVLWR